MTNTKMNYKKLLSIFVLIIILALAFFFIYKNINDFKSLTLSSPHLIFYLVLIFLTNYFLLGTLTKYLIAPLHVKLSHKESFQIAFVTGFYNLITPFRGGMAARALYLKKKHNFSYSDFFASLSASYILLFLIASLFGIVSTLLIYLNEGILSIPLLILFTLIFIPMFIVVTFSPRIPLTKNNYINHFIKVVNGWHLIKNNLKVILIVSIITVLQLLMMTSMLFLQFQVFGIEVSFIKCLFLTSIGSISIVIGITPANLGVAEAVTVFSALTIGITPVQSLSASILGRLVSVVVLFTLGPIFSYILFKNTKNG